jgi:hypothetical protein
MNLGLVNVWKVSTSMSQKGVKDSAMWKTAWTCLSGQYGGFYSP